MDLNDARVLATSLMAQHGLHGWRLVFDNAKTRAGICRPGREEIGLSRPLTRLHPAGEVTDTILHEIAHALVGPTHGHDAVWRATARRIGCTGDRCVAGDVPRVEGAWVGTCPAGHRATAHRRPERVKSCRQCSATFDPAAIFTWTFRGRPAAMHPNYEIELDHIRDRATSDVRAGSREPAAVPRTHSPLHLPVGTVVRLVGGGKYAGLTGTIQSRGRTRYKIRTSQGLLVAPFALVRRVQGD